MAKIWTLLAALVINNQPVEPPTEQGRFSTKMDCTAQMSEILIVLRAKANTHQQVKTDQATGQVYWSRRLEGYPQRWETTRYWCEEQDYVPRY